MVVAGTIGVTFFALWVAENWVSKDEMGSLEVLFTLFHAPHMLALLGGSLLFLFVAAYVAANGMY